MVFYAQSWEACLSVGEKWFFRLSKGKLVYFWDYFRLSKGNLFSGNRKGVNGLLAICPSASGESGDLLRSVEGKLLFFSVLDPAPDTYKGNLCGLFNPIPPRYHLGLLFTHTVGENGCSIPL